MASNLRRLSSACKAALLFLAIFGASAWTLAVLASSQVPGRPDQPDRSDPLLTPWPSPTTVDTNWRASPATPDPISNRPNETQRQAVTPRAAPISINQLTSPLPTPTWFYNDMGEAEVPILLYHHVSNDPVVLRYGVQIAHFRQQMEFLKQEGYTALTVAELAAVLLDGGLLPPRPVVITFDDGNQDVYQNAFPILKDLGFKATLYVVAAWVNSEGCLSAEMLKEMAAAGWEIGSHSTTHTNLVGHPDLWGEIYLSKVSLEEAVGMPVETFAYPFASANSDLFYKVSKYGYRAAVCVSPYNQQSIYNLYCLNRREVKDDFPLAQFRKLLETNRVR